MVVAEICVKTVAEREVRGIVVERRVDRAVADGDILVGQAREKLLLAS